MLVTPDIATRESVKAWLTQTLDREFGDLQARVTRLENGPPVGFPVQFRVSGEHVDEVLRIAEAVRAKVAAHPSTRNVNLDWDEPSKVVRLRIDQDRARALGVSSAQVASFLQGSLSGTPVSTYREGNELIEILLRGPDEERSRLALLGSLAVPTATGKPVPHTIAPRREGDPPALYADARKAREVLGWSPRHTSIDSIVASAVRWHLSRPAGYGDRWISRSA